MHAVTYCGLHCSPYHSHDVGRLIVIYVEQVVYCSFPIALLLPYAVVSPYLTAPCHAPYAPDSTIMHYHASI
jgi:hypothetical protein